MSSRFFRTGLFQMFLLFGVVFVDSAQAQSEEADQETIAAIKAAIPEATAMADDDWQRLVSSTVPKYPPISPMGLYLRMNSSDENSEEHLNEFGYLGTPPDPAKMAREIARGDHRTWIKSDRITELTCEIDGDKAKGVVKYVVPKMIRGQFHYTAVKVGEEWQINGFILPVRKIKLVREEGGDWEHKEWKDKK